MKKFLAILVVLVAICACVYFTTDRKEVVEVPAVEAVDTLKVATDTLTVEADSMTVAVDTLKK